MNNKNISIAVSLVIQAKDLALDLLFPKFCVSCGKHGQHICLECFESIEKSMTRTCFYCGRISTEGKICTKCKSSEKPSFNNVIWAGSYKDPILKDVIHGLKYGGLQDLAEVVGEMLVQTIVRSGLSLDVVVIPVPLHWEKEKKREFNQSELITRYICKRLDLHGGMALSRVKETDSQVGLDKNDRSKNVENAFKCVDPQLVRDRLIFLVDDVATTGATLNECAKTLKATGAKKIIAIVAARG